jgi:hypothetical protein
VALAFADRHRTRPLFATLDQLQSALTDDEALLSYQVGLWETFEGNFGGGSWLIAATRTQRTVHRLPDRMQLTDAIPMFVGLIEAGHGREGVAAARLYRELLADALAALPSHVKRLVVIRWQSSPVAVRGVEGEARCTANRRAVSADGRSVGDRVAAMAACRCRNTRAQSSDARRSRA